MINTIMMRLKYLILLLLLAPMTLWAAKLPHRQRVYMFGFAASFTDSIAYQTDIQCIDGAWVEGKSDFLVDRSLYSLQLQYYVEGQLKNTNSICSVFYHKKLRKLQKIWTKVRKRYQKAEGLQLKTLPKQDFFFIAEEYKPIINEDVPVQGGQPPAARPGK